jgi:hypothetical protein
VDKLPATSLSKKELAFRREGRRDLTPSQATGCRNAKEGQGTQEAGRGTPFCPKTAFTVPEQANAVLEASPV